MKRRSSRRKDQEQMNVVLQRCDSSCLKLSNKLDLSSMHLQELNIDTLPLMKNLTQLDVSKNNLCQFQSSHPIKTLEFLDCSSNNFDSSSIIGICKLFPNLTEIKFFKNRGLKAADHYEIVARLHKLSKINDMDANVMRSELEKVNRQLISRIHKEFVAAFGSETDFMTPNMTLDELKNNFADILQRNVSVGSADLKIFVQGKLNELAYSYIDEKSSLNCLRYKKKSSKAMDSNGNKAIFPREIFVNHESNYLSKKFKLLNQHEIDSGSCKFSPKYLLRLHSFNNDPDDKLTEIWQAAFEPKKTGSSGSVCAICGGEIVAFVDCKTGKLIKRYKHPKEIFYCLAWSSITLSSNDDKKTSTIINILAAGGQCGEIRLIYPSQKICYAHVSVPNRQKTPLCSLIFHPKSPKLLFSGSEDGHIRVWEIDVPPGEYSAVNVAYLHGMTADSRPRILQISDCGNWLLAAYDKFCIMWNITDIIDRKKKPVISKIKYRFPYSNGAVPYFDGLSLLKNNLAVTKRKGDGFISLWDPFHDIDKLNFEVKVATEVDADVLAHLNYTKSSEWFMQLASHGDSGLISVGNNQSQVLLFDLKSSLSQVDSLKFHVPVIESFKVIEFPVKKMKINQVIVSTDYKFIVAITSSNLVCVWEIS